MAFTRNMLIATINSTEVFHELSMKHVARRRANVRGKKRYFSSNIQNTIHPTIK